MAGPDDLSGFFPPKIIDSMKMGQRKWATSSSGSGLQMWSTMSRVKHCFIHETSQKQGHGL